MLRRDADPNSKNIKNSNDKNKVKTDQSFCLNKIGHKIKIFNVKKKKRKKHFNNYYLMWWNESDYYQIFKTLIKGACQPLPNEGHVGDFSPTETALLEKILQCPA